MCFNLYEMSESSYKLFKVFMLKVTKGFTKAAPQLRLLYYSDCALAIKVILHICTYRIQFTYNRDSIG